MEQMGISGAALTSDLLSAREELAVELEFVLPDDCPDISKLLRAGLRLGPSSVSSAEEGILAEGTVLADVWYIADTGLLHRATGRTSYSKRMRCESPPGLTAPLPTGVCEYCNARAVNQRRVECKGAMWLSADLATSHSRSYLTACGREDVETLTQTRSLLLPVTRSFARTSLDEERDFPEETPAAALLLRWDASARVTDQKAVEGRLVVKGEVELRLCCLPEEGGELVPLTLNLPFSQLMELEGLTPDSGCDLSCAVAWMEVSLRGDEQGRSRRAAVQGELLLRAGVHRQTELTAVTDAFGLHHRAELASTVLTLPVLRGDVAVRQSFEHTCEPPAAGVDTVSEAWGYARMMSPRRTGQGLAVPVRVTAVGFLRDGNGRPALLDKTWEVETEIPTDAEDPVLRGAEASLENLRVTVEEGALVCRGETAVRGSLYGRERWEVLENVSLDTDSSLPPPEAPLTLVWAAEEQSVWEIARQYAVPVAGVQVEDGLALIQRV